MFTPGACCRDCRSTAKTECDTLTREWKLARARREARRLRILHRGQTPWAAVGPPPSPAGYTHRPVELTSIEPGPARRTKAHA